MRAAGSLELPWRRRGRLGYSFGSALPSRSVTEMRGRGRIWLAHLLKRRRLGERRSNRSHAYDDELDASSVFEEQVADMRPGEPSIHVSGGIHSSKLTQPAP